MYSQAKLFIAGSLQVVAACNILKELQERSREGTFVPVSFRTRSDAGPSQQVFRDATCYELGFLGHLGFPA